MYTLLKKNKIFLLIAFLSAFFLIILFCFFVIFDDDFKKETIIPLENVQYNIDEYRKFKKNFINNELPIIAHAGGGFKNLTYTNSIDALDYNKNNYDLFELDFFLTDDEKLVCSHDYGGFLKSFKKFEVYVQNKKEYKPCTYKSLKIWLEKNPEKKIVTDFKSDNLSGLKFIAKNFENFEKRFIPQIYNPSEYQKVNSIGYKDIIWTLYRYNKNNNKVIKFAKKMSLYAITMPRERAQTELPVLLKKNNIKSFVHTINSMEEYFIYKNYFKVDQIYSDWIN